MKQAVQITNVVGPGHVIRLLRLLQNRLNVCRLFNPNTASCFIVYSFHPKEMMKSAQVFDVKSRLDLFLHFRQCVVTSSSDNDDINIDTQVDLFSSWRSVHTWIRRCLDEAHLQMIVKSSIPASWRLLQTIMLFFNLQTRCSLSETIKPSGCVMYTSSSSSPLRKLQWRLPAVQLQSLLNWRTMRAQTDSNLTTGENVLS